MKKIMILGINGFTGWHFQQYIQKHQLTKSYSFVGVDRLIKKQIGINYIKADLCQMAHLEKLFKSQKPDYLINLAGMLRSESLDDLIKINADMSRNIADIVFKNHIPVKKMVFIGSAAEYGLPQSLPVDEKTPLNPVSPYGLSKVLQSQYVDYYVKNHGLDINIIRTFNVIGRFISPTLSIGSFLRQINETKPGGKIFVGNLKTKRDYMDIEDAIDGYWKVLLKGKKGEIYNLCLGKSVLMKDILSYMVEKSQKRIDIVVNQNQFKGVDVKDIYGSYAKVTKDTGWKPKHDVYSALDKLDYA